MDEKYLAILKVVCTAFSGIMGVLGILTETRKTVIIPPKKSGEPEEIIWRLNSWGWWTFSLATVFLALAIVSQIWEDRVAKKEAQEQLSRAQSTLEGVERLLARVHDVSVSVSFEFPLSSTNFDSDLDWLGQLPKNAPPANREPIPGFEGVLSGFNIAAQMQPRLDKVIVLPESPWNPYYRGQTPLKNFLQRLSVEASIYKAKDGSRFPTNGPPWEATPKHAEYLAWRTHTRPVSGELTLPRNRMTATCRITAPVLKPPTFTDGRITSLKDLPNCQLAVALFADPAVLALSGATREIVYQALQETKISEIWLEIDGLRFDLSQYSHRNVAAGAGNGTFVFELPATFEELMKSAR